MLIRLFDDSDGKCFARLGDGCAVISETLPCCGTYRCKWYKPADKKEWVRLDTKNMVRLFPIEERYEVYAEDKQ